MTVGTTLFLLFYLGILLGAFRSVLNWVILNKLEGTNQPNLSRPSLYGLILTFRHTMISVVKLYWFEKNRSLLMKISNSISVSLYFVLVSFMLILLFTYKL